MNVNSGSNNIAARPHEQMAKDGSWGCWMTFPMIGSDYRKGRHNRPRWASRAPAFRASIERRMMDRAIFERPFRHLRLDRTGYFQYNLQRAAHLLSRPTSFRFARSYLLHKPMQVWVSEPATSSASMATRVFPIARPIRSTSIALE